MKISLGILLFVLLFLGGIVWLGFQTREEPPTSPNQANQTTETVKKEYAAIKTALKNGFIRLGSFIHDFKEEIVAIGTLFIAAFTVILAFATFFLYFATRDLVTGAKDTAERQLRAYLTITPVMLSSINPDENSGFIFEQKNQGQTPAYSATTRGVILFLDHPLPDNFPFPQLPMPGSRTILTPKRKFVGQVVAKQKFTQTELIEALQEGGKRLFIFFGKSIMSMLSIVIAGIGVVALFLATPVWYLWHSKETGLGSRQALRIKEFPLFSMTQTSIT